MGEFELSMSVPVDDEGFLRRSCQACERDLAWIAAQDDAEATPEQEGGYFCPYCARQAEAGEWWTEAQIEAAKREAFENVLRPELEGLAGAGSSGMLEISVEGPDSDASAEIHETSEGLRRVDFSCHPEDPVKVLLAWEAPVHCPICGEPAVSSDE